MDPAASDVGTSVNLNPAPMDLLQQISEQPKQSNHVTEQQSLISPPVNYHSTDTDYSESQARDKKQRDLGKISHPPTKANHDSQPHQPTIQTVGAHPTKNDNSSQVPQPPRNHTNSKPAQHFSATPAPTNQQARTLSALSTENTLLRARVTELEARAHDAEPSTKHLADENALLRRRIQALQSLVKCDDCSLMQYVMDMKISQAREGKPGVVSEERGECGCEVRVGGRRCGCSTVVMGREVARVRCSDRGFY